MDTTKTYLAEMLEIFVFWRDNKHAGFKVYLKHGAKLVKVFANNTNLTFLYKIDIEGF